MPRRLIADPVCGKGADTSGTGGRGSLDCKVVSEIDLGRPTILGTPSRVDTQHLGGYNYSGFPEESPDGSRFSPLKGAPDDTPEDLLHQVSTLQRLSPQDPDACQLLRLAAPGAPGANQACGRGVQEPARTTVQALFVPGQAPGWDLPGSQGQPDSLTARLPTDAVLLLPHGFPDRLPTAIFSVDGGWSRF